MLGTARSRVLVSTPAFCQTAICGPVLDLFVAAEAEFPEVTFIHVEVYASAEEVEADGLQAPLAPAVEALGLPFEPALFLIEADGTIAERIDVIYDEVELPRVPGHPRPLTDPSGLVLHDRAPPTSRVAGHRVNPCSDGARGPNLRRSGALGGRDAPQHRHRTPTRGRSGRLCRWGVRGVSPRRGRWLRGTSRHRPGSLSAAAGRTTSSLERRERSDRVTARPTPSGS